MMDMSENGILSRVLRVTLEEPDSGRVPASITLLPGVAEELRADGVPVTLSENTVDRVLMARLTDPPPDEREWPVHYLIGVYSRATDALRTAPETAKTSLALVKQLAVAYSALLLTMEDMFPQPEAAWERRGAQLMDAILADRMAGSFGISGNAGGAATLPGGAGPMPPGFLEELIAHLKAQSEAGEDDDETDTEEWIEILRAMARALIKSMSTLSPLGDYTLPLSALHFLLSNRVLAPDIVALPEWTGHGLNQPRSGPSLEKNTLLGAAFAISGLPNVHGPSAPRRPSLAEEAWPGGVPAPPPVLHAAMQAMQSATAGLHTALHALIMVVLRNQETREAAMDWLMQAVRTNGERAKMHPDPRRASSDGFMLNLYAVLLRLSDPFMGPNSDKAWPRLEAAYLSDPKASMALPADETRLAATVEEVAAWAAELPPRKYHFICECFFMTARMVGLAYAKSIETLRTLPRRRADFEGAVADLEDQAQGRFAGHPIIMSRLAQYREMVTNLKAADAAYQAILSEPSMMANTLSFCRLMTEYMLRLASPAYARGEPLTLPLPTPPPMEFAQLPEAWVENLGEVLILVAHTSRGASLLSAPIESIMVFLTVSLASPDYVKNPYLRGRLVEVLHEFMPPQEDAASGLPLGRRRSSSEVAALFQAHPLVLKHMVRSLIRLYVDIEMTDRHNTFYEKFTTRYQIGEIMAYLWQLPQHRDAWRHVAQHDTYLYVRFVNMMINDSQVLLQEALESLPKVQVIEKEMEDEAAWAALPDAERAEKEEELRTESGRLKSDFYLASVCVQTMQYTAEDEVVGSLYFNMQVRDRQARILNFFLKYLTVPSERRKLKVRDPERFNWHPRRLLAQLAGLHVSLYRRDPEGWVAANVADTDSLGSQPGLFELLDGLLSRLGTVAPADIAALRELSARVREARLAAAEEEQAFDDVPPEYEDPLLGTLMRDPVRLPSGNVLDRATIMQHLLTDQRDPFSRAPMREQDVTPMPELAAEIAAWLADQRRKRAEAAAAESVAQAGVLGEESSSMFAEGAANGADDEGRLPTAAMLED